MKQRIAVVIFVFALMLLPLSVHASTGQGNACWGQATAVFAQMGEMGKHASQEPTPRMGLHNLAVALYEAGVIADDSMAALGQFVASSLVDENGDPLTIEACMD